MTEPFIGEVKICAFAFAPQGWALCNGALLPVAQNQALNALLGSTYGGDARTSVGLPDLRGRTPVHRNYASSQYALGYKGGSETVVLNPTNVPPHTHQFNAATETTSQKLPAPTGATVFNTAQQNFYVAPQANGSDLVPMDTRTCSSYGSGSAHNNMQPSLVLNFIIATVGLWPPRN